MSHFRKYWSSDLEDEVLELLKVKVRYRAYYNNDILFQLIDIYFKFEERYKKLQQPQAGMSTSNSSCSTVHQTAGLLQRNAVNSDSDDEDNLSLTNDSELWMVEFDRYIQTVEAVSKDNKLDIVEWWGVSEIIL